MHQKTCQESPVFADENGESLLSWLFREQPGSTAKNEGLKTINYQMAES